jgi:hypothetical protein
MYSFWHLLFWRVFPSSTVSMKILVAIKLNREIMIVIPTFIKVVSVADKVVRKIGIVADKEIFKRNCL